MNSLIQSNAYIAIRPSSGLHKVVKIVPDTTISLGKYGSVSTNSLIGRPFYLTFEILDKAKDEKHAQLRIVPAQELHAEALADTTDGPLEDTDDDLVVENVESLARNNRLTVDDPSRQILSMDEIEELKRAGTGSGKDIITRIMKSHSALGEKTAFSLAKYTLRKTKKYMRRFTVLPVDVSLLAHWMLHEKEPVRIMEMREEMLGLVASWSNAHFNTERPESEQFGGRWLVVDDTGGLVVALLAERMCILQPTSPNGYPGSSTSGGEEPLGLGDSLVGDADGNGDVDENEPSSNQLPKETQTRSKRRRHHAADAMSAENNTITLIHPASQPNISLLSYFSYNPTETTSSAQIAASDHPLHSHLKTLTWLQLLHPSMDLACIEPEKASEEELATWKAGKRSSYFRKRRRWANTMRVVNETRDGGFDGLVVASTMDNLSILNHTVPLLRGGAQVVVYHPNVEPLTEVMDAYSTARKTAFINLQNLASDESSNAQLLEEDFAVDPRLLLAPGLQTVRAREWQVLPGRTHPMMTSKGGAESYLFTATRVIPADGKVEARGRFARKRKVDDMVGSEEQSPLPEPAETNGLQV